MAIIKCDKPMARHKMRSWRVDNEGWRCDHDCERCICGMKKNSDGEWHHIAISDKPRNPKGGKFV